MKASVSPCTHLVGRGPCSSHAASGRPRTNAARVFAALGHHAAAITSAGISRYDELSLLTEDDLKDMGMPDGEVERYLDLSVRLEREVPGLQAVLGAGLGKHAPLLAAHGITGASLHAAATQGALEDVEGLSKVAMRRIIQVAKESAAREA